MAFTWTDDMVATLNKALADGELSYTDAEDLAKDLKVSVRSLTAKARVLGGVVAKKESTAPAKWSDDEAQTLVKYVQSGYTDVEIAEMMGKSTKQIRGKALSLGIVGDLKIVKKEKVDAPKTFTEEEAALLTKMAGEGKFIEEMADATGKTVRQVRGKLLSLKLKAPQRDHKDSAKTKVYTEEVAAKVLAAAVAGKTAEAIAEEFGLKVAGLKSFLGKNNVKTPDMAGKATGKKYSDEDIATIAKVAANGGTIDEAADALGKTVQSVRVVAGRNKIQFAKAA